MGAASSMVCLLVLDGWGIADEGRGNAVTLANTPNLDKLFFGFPHTALKVSGEAVGLPPGQMGNSEVGHLNLGAGRVVFQDLTRINRAIADGSFFRNPELIKAIVNARDNKSSLHIMGLLSDGGVHSDIKHLKALVAMAKDTGCLRVFLHLFLDGRDVSPTSGFDYIKEILDYLQQEGIGEIATVSGRYYAMDRDHRWDRTHLAYKAIVYGEGPVNPNPVALVCDSYNRGVTDEFITPTVISKKVEACVGSADSVISFNFRPDRTRQLTEALIKQDFDSFDRGPAPPDPYFVSMTEYDATFARPVAYPPEELKNVLAVVLSHSKKKQLHIAETEKYAHVTFFFNGGVEEPNPGEIRVLVPSPTDVPTYDKKPEMSARQVTDEFIRQLESQHFDFVIANIANCDMVGHTGNLSATIKAVEVVDECVGRIVAEVQSLGGVCLITSDHGNAERMEDQEGGPDTAHTLALVPMIITIPAASLKSDCALCDVAPTVLTLLTVPVPPEMTGCNIIMRM